MPKTSIFFPVFIGTLASMCINQSSRFNCFFFLTDLSEHVISSLTANKAATRKTSYSRCNYFDTRVETRHYRRENICGRLACLLCTSLCHTAEQSRQEKEKKNTQHSPLSHLLSISYSRSSADMLEGCKEKEKGMKIQVES